MKFFDEKHLLIGVNECHWNWEYDSITVKASLIFNLDNGKLFLDLRKFHFKTGLGAGKTERSIGRYDVGTLKKPSKRLINSLLSKHKLDRPFPREGWYFDCERTEDNKSVYYQLNLSKCINYFMDSPGVSRMLKLNKIKKILKK